MLDREFITSRRAIIDLIREEVNHFPGQSESSTGNGAYLGLVLTIAHNMPLPLDLLESIIRLPASDRDQLFGDQFGLIVRAIALAPMQQYDFVEKWTWDRDRKHSDRREMVDFYVHACDLGNLDCETAINALITGLRRALFEAPILVAPYAENLAFLTPKTLSSFLDEVFCRENVDWFLNLPDLRRMTMDSQFAMDQFHHETRIYRNVNKLISQGVMFSEAALKENHSNLPNIHRFIELPPEKPSSSTIRNNDRTPRNGPCPCGSGKKFKKCCLHRGE